MTETTKRGGEDGWFEEVEVDSARPAGGDNHHNEEQDDYVFDLDTCIAQEHEIRGAPSPPPRIDKGKGKASGESSAHAHPPSPARTRRPFPASATKPTAPLTGLAAMHARAGAGVTFANMADHAAKLSGRARTTSNRPMRNFHDETDAEPEPLLPSDFKEQQDKLDKARARLLAREDAALIDASGVRKLIEKKFPGVGVRHALSDPKRPTLEVEFDIGHRCPLHDADDDFDRRLKAKLVLDHFQWELHCLSHKPRRSVVFVDAMARFPEDSLMKGAITTYPDKPVATETYAPAVASYTAQPLFPGTESSATRGGDEPASGAPKPKRNKKLKTQGKPQPDSQKKKEGIPRHVPDDEAEEGEESEKESSEPSDGEDLDSASEKSADGDANLLDSDEDPEMFAAEAKYKAAAAAAKKKQEQAEPMPNPDDDAAPRRPGKRSIALSSDDEAEAAVPPATGTPAATVEQPTDTSTVEGTTGALPLKRRTHLERKSSGSDSE